jgi:hypothetical protein
VAANSVMEAPAKAATKKDVPVGDRQTPPERPAAGRNGDLLAAMEAMKPLVDSMGKEQVKRIVDLLG